MQHHLLRLHALKVSRHYLWSEPVLSLVLAIFIFVIPTSAAMRFQERSLYINDSEPGATTSYEIAFRYMSPQTVGSVDIMFCDSPIPYQECVAPAGLNASNASLVDQLGETGFTIRSKSANHIVITRPPSMISSGGSTYKFDTIVNPTASNQSFSVRLRSHSSTDATGPQVDFGSVKGQVARGISIETQVPPMLIFCAAEIVEDNCAGTNENYYSDMGQLNGQSVLTSQSQMAVGTNASGGFAITANGTPMSAGTNVIESIENPTESKPGSNQFGINLVANSSPNIGKNPEGLWANAITSPEYSIPNKYKYVSGDVVAFSPNVSLMKKYTVSYIVNSRPDLRAGVYTTTITYIASGRF